LPESACPRSPTHCCIAAKRRDGPRADFTFLPTVSHDILLVLPRTTLKNSPVTISANEAIQPVSLRPRFFAASLPRCQPQSFGYPRYATSAAPVAIRIIPNQLGPDNFSPRKNTAKTATNTTLSLSIGATRAASPIFSARK